MSKQSAIPVQTIDNPQVIRRWAFFDWANSSYALVIVVAIFPAYFLEATDENLTFFGLPTTNSALLAYSVSFAYFVVMLLLPALAGIADYGGKKKFFMRWFTGIGSLACVLMFFFTKGNVQLGFWTYVVATIGFAGGMVFYNAFLPEIASEKNLDRTSALGFSMGYIGSIILLIINLLCITFWEKSGFATEATAVRTAFLAVGIWWFAFSRYALAGLPADRPNDQPLAVFVRKGWAELVAVFRAVRQNGNLLTFLAAFLFYNAGVQTVLFLASAFAKKELRFETSQLILVILILQVVAIFGATIFSRLSDKKGNKLSLFVMLVIWTGVCLAAYFVKTGLDFYLLAGAVGLVMGGIQSLSRSTYAKLLPENTRQTASYFSFFDVVEKASVIFGTLVFGLLDQLTGSMRYSVLALGLFFVISLVILIKVRIQRTV